MGRPLGRTVLLAALLMLALASVSQAATLRVTTTRDSKNKACTHKRCSLRDAVTFAKAGDTVVLPKSKQPYKVTLGEIKILQPITIEGAGATKSVIRGNGRSRVFEVTAAPTSPATITIKGVTITGGHATSMPGGGGVLVDAPSTVVALNLVVDKTAVNGDNAAVSTGRTTCCGGGGGIYSDGGDVTIEHSTVSVDTATVQGSTSTTGDVCCDGGGGVYDNAQSGSIVVVASTLADDFATVNRDYQCCHGGGAIYEDAGSPGDVTISGSKLRDNGFTLDGTQADGSGALNNCCSGGGAVYQHSDAMTVKHSKVTGNSAAISSGQCCHGGGAFYLDGSGPLTMTRSTLSGNTATVKGPTRSTTRSCCSGGGAVATSGPFELKQSTLSGNASSVRSASCCEGGGAVQIDGSSGVLMSVASTIADNGSTVSAKAAFSGGGGVFMHTSGTSPDTYTNSTISGNSTNGSNSAAGGGGGLYFLTGSSTTTNVLANATLAGNSAKSGAGGGLLNAGSQVGYKNSILALNSAGHDANCAGFEDSSSRIPTFTSLGYNLTTSPDKCGLGATGDRVVKRSAVKLGPVANNGGPTKTLAELRGSAAIDHGNPAGCTDPSDAPLTTDQRGKPRPDAGETVCDIGAYEYQDKSAG